MLKKNDCLHREFILDITKRSLLELFKELGAVLKLSPHLKIGLDKFFRTEKASRIFLFLESGSTAKKEKKLRNIKDLVAQ